MTIVALLLFSKLWHFLLESIWWLVRYRALRSYCCNFEYTAVDQKNKRYSHRMPSVRGRTWQPMECHSGLPTASSLRSQYACSAISRLLGTDLAWVLCGELQGCQFLVRLYLSQSLWKYHIRWQFAAITDCNRYSFARRALPKSPFFNLLVLPFCG